MHKRFVIGEYCKRSAFEEVSEMADSKVDGEKVPVKSAVAGLGRSELLAVESDRLPNALNTLLEHSTDGCVRGVRS